MQEIARETHAEVMIMGRPTRSPTADIFKMHAIDAIVEELAQEGGLKVILVTSSES